MNARSSAIDPVCGMQVNPSEAAATREYKGRVYHLCSVWCAEKFDADADAYIAAARLREVRGGDGGLGPPS